MGKELVTRIWLALLIGIPVTSVLSAQPSGSAAMESLNGGDTLRAAHLTRAQFQQLFEQLEVTAFDEPESWEKEIRIRRVHLGRTEGLVVQGTNLLCGATGNCQTWLFRRRGITWLPMFRGYAPVIDGFRLEKQAHNGMKDLSVSINVSADVTRYVSFYFDGIEYREERCDESSRTDDGARKTSRVQCD